MPRDTAIGRVHTASGAVVHIVQPSRQAAMSCYVHNARRFAKVVRNTRRGAVLPTPRLDIKT